MKRRLDWIYGNGEAKTHREHCAVRRMPARDKDALCRVPCALCLEKIKDIRRRREAEAKKVDSL